MLQLLLFIVWGEGLPMLLMQVTNANIDFRLKKEHLKSPPSMHNCFLSESGECRWCTSLFLHTICGEPLHYRYASYLQHVFSVYLVSQSVYWKLPQKINW